MRTVFPRRKFFHRGLSGKSFAAENFIFSRFARKKRRGGSAGELSLIPVRRFQAEGCVSCCSPRGVTPKFFL